MWKLFPSWHIVTFVNQYLDIWNLWVSWYIFYILEQGSRLQKKVTFVVTKKKGVWPNCVLVRPTEKVSGKVSLEPGRGRGDKSKYLQQPYCHLSNLDPFSAASDFNIHTVHNNKQMPRVSETCSSSAGFHWLLRQGKKTFWEGIKTFLPGKGLLKVKQIWRLIALWLR